MSTRDDAGVTEGLLPISAERAVYLDRGDPGKIAGGKFLLEFLDNLIKLES